MDLASNGIRSATEAKATFPRKRNKCLLFVEKVRDPTQVDNSHERSKTEETYKSCKIAFRTPNAINNFEK